MSKITGLGMSLTVDNSAGTGKDISEDVNTFTINQSRELIDVTGLDKEAYERLGGLKDAELQLSGAFDPTADKSHAVFSNQDNSRTFVLVFPGSVATFTLEAVIESYEVQRGNDGALTWSVTARIADGTTGQWT